MNNNIMGNGVMYLEVGRVFKLKRIIVKQREIYESRQQAVLHCMDSRVFHSNIARIYYQLYKCLS